MGYLPNYDDSLQPNLGNDYTFKQYSQKDVPQFDASNSAGTGAAGAGAGMMMGGPVGAGIMVGGQLLSGYMAQKAADERAKRQAQMQIAQNQAAGETNALQNLNNTYRGALR